MSDEVEKLCTIANGMCVGQCEGPTIYEVVDNRSVQIAHVIKRSKPHHNMIV